MGKTFKYGEKKNRQRKQRMKRFNEFKNVVKSLRFNASEDYNRSEGTDIQSNMCTELQNSGYDENVVIINEVEVNQSEDGSSALTQNYSNYTSECSRESYPLKNVTKSFGFNTSADHIRSEGTDTQSNMCTELPNSGYDENVVIINEVEVNQSDDENSDLTQNNNSYNTGFAENFTEVEMAIGSLSLAEENEDIVIVDNVDISTGFRIEGRRIVEMDFFLNQLMCISDHNFGECSLSNMEIRKEIRNGLWSKIIFQCNKCKKNFPILTSEDEKTTDTMCLNSTAVLASNMIGIGYTQLEQFSSVMSIPVMCSDRFKSLNDTIGGFWEDTAEESMKEAAEEEIQAAIARGDVDKEDGIPYISVIIDGCYCKRSYNRNYTALSGVGAIVGATFGKVLWIGVRNKYCVICVRHENKNMPTPPHFCTRNYSGPSSEIESQAIVQGFQRSVELYNVRYLNVISDGDSSTYLKIMESKPYQQRFVKKTACTNHLKRNYRKQLEAATTGCPRGMKKLVCNSLERIRKDICCAIQFRKSEERDESEKISLLKSDIDNVIHHVFGDHANCPNYIKEFCKNDDENYIPALTASGTFEKLAVPTRRLMYCAKDLLLGETNNPAEHYNSIVAKLVGGKRVNFALSNSYKFKANVAAVQFNTQTPLLTLYRKRFQTTPSVLTKKIELKRLQKSLREKARRKRNKQNNIRPKRFNSVKESGGSGYGENCQQPDLSVDDFKNEKELFIEKLRHHQANRTSIEKATRTKEECSLWQEITSTVLMASNFGAICKARVLSGHVKDLTQGVFAQSKAKKHNNESLPIALQQLAKDQKLSLQSCGLYIDKEYMCFAASPTGITNDGEMIIEIQCPLIIMNTDPTDPAVLAKLPYIQVTQNQILGLKKTHDIYFQIQGQLHVCEKHVCIFSVWTSTQCKMYVEKIERDDNFFNSKMKHRLLTFYYDWLLPELIDPRLPRNMEVRVPL